MITETKTQRGRTVLTVETEEEFLEVFARMDQDDSIEIDAPPELFGKHGAFDSPEEHGLLAEDD